jgi:hypothetical protein
LTDQFFEPLPSDAALDEMFVRLSEIPAGTSPPPPRCTEHWSVPFRAFAEREGLNLPPGPAAAKADVDEFWESQGVRFPIEELQKRKLSPFHALLNALVEIDDDPPAAAARPAFLREHALLPEIPCDPYLALPFEDRLAIELASLELDKPDDAPCGPLTELELQKQGFLNELKSDFVPPLRALEGFIRSNIAEYRERERQRRETREKIDATLRALSRPGRRGI